MPEGDTIYRLASRLHDALGGQTITDYQASDPRLAREDLVGRQVLRVRAAGKNLFLDFSGNLTLHSHLKMLGRWSIEVPPRAEALERAGSRVHGEFRPAQLRLRTESVSVVARLNHVLRWVRTKDAVLLTRRLGPDLLDSSFHRAEARARLRSAPDTAVGVAIMRQDLVAGIGNVYKSELLFLCRLDPFAPVAVFSDDALDGLLSLGQSLLKRNVGPGWRRTRRLGSGPRLWVYERAGERCMKCDGTILMQRQGPKLRSTYFCPTCQPSVASDAASGGSGAVGLRSRSNSSRTV